MRLTSITFVISISVCIAAGCALPLTTVDQTIDKTGQMLDTQFNESAQRIEQLLVDISRAGGILTARPKRSDVPLNKDKERITVQWQGDAPEVLRKLAAVKGLKFAIKGRPIPMPVSIQSANVDFIQVLENIGMQLGRRADVILKTDALEIHYHGI